MAYCFYETDSEAFLTFYHIKWRVIEKREKKDRFSKLFRHFLWLANFLRKLESRANNPGEIAQVI